ncbi:lipocalin family protein [Hymenobacter persicinus]|uniref:Lipocalin-like domain-containing protein n=1 Tax=Hymenobacter persicinus TaxID=2025506 RepID=A0A4Q5L9U6_9BACT|nr:lipocalin family protein [Hymenobacter persicinus]RYU77675.1 hypothetical protein EWM57_17270 [Hymenobacter persicinus]
MFTKLSYSSYLFLFCQIVLVTSCNKSATPAPALTATEKLMAKSWYLTARTLTYNGTVDDLFATYPNCARDDFYRFQADGTLQFDNGIEKCNPSEPQAVTGTWSVGANDTNLTMLHPYLGGTVGLASRGGTIQELTEQKLIVVYSETFGTTINVTTSTYQGK